jgi:phenylpropionate dioxygenase-like ring-hydroxylating dioxygenase large terminal subunit
VLKKGSNIPTYQDLLHNEPLAVPESLKLNSLTDLGCSPLDVECYLSRDYYELEKQRLWPRVWQAVCRETEVAEPGDFYSHQIADINVLVVRTEQGCLRAYPNACLHRGRQLKTGSGSSRELKCPYHGFTWNLNGQFRGAPCQWDFPHIDQQSFGLPSLRVETWGGWVFVNQSADAPSLRDHLGEMVDHFKRWEPENTYKAMHLKKVLRCNWKVAHEAFIESYHTVATHPQLLPYTGDANSQYDCFNDYVSRTITPMGVISPHLPGHSEQQAVDQWLRVYGVGEGEDLPELAENVSAREYLGELNIARFSRMYDRELAGVATYSEVLDAILYSVFPNFAPWAGFRPNVTYRFLPWEDRHDMCTMEIMLLLRFPEGERPRDVPEQFVGPDQTLAETAGIDPELARVFDQDFSNLSMVQRGLSSLRDGQVQLANYQEVRIRHFHQTLEKYLSAETFS